MYTLVTQAGGKGRSLGASMMRSKLINTPLAPVNEHDENGVAVAEEEEGEGGERGEDSEGGGTPKA